MQPHQFYLICATQRSGSTLFCEILKNTGIAGDPQEFFEFLQETGLPRQASQYFQPHDEGEIQDVEEILDILGRSVLQFDTARLTRWREAGYSDYLTEVLKEGTTPNGVFGAKIMWGHFEDFLALTAQVPLLHNLDHYQTLTRIFPGLKYIWVTRRDKVRQAISLWKAIQTQRWRHDDESASQAAEDHKKPVFHFGAIQHLKQMMTAHDQAWQQFFSDHQLQPQVIVYEEMVKDLEGTLRETLRYLEIEPPADLQFMLPKMVRQSDNRSDRWEQRYLELEALHNQGPPEAV